MREEALLNLIGSWMLTFKGVCDESAPEDF